MALVLHHLDERVAALRELRRVLRPEGRLVVSTHHPTADWLRLGGSYFASSRVDDVWQGGWHLSYWRQPLGAVTGEFEAAGFVIERLVEPLPVEEMRDRFPDDYERLTTAPGFIAFRLRPA